MSNSLCQFSVAGCPFQTENSADIVRKHMRDDSLKHLSLLCDTVRDLYAEKELLQTQWTEYEKYADHIGNRFSQLHYIAGTHLIWKIDSYKEKFMSSKVGAKSTIYSPAFLTGRHGYKLILLANLNGDGKAKDRYMSVFVSICRSDHDAVLPWPFTHNITVTLLNQADNPADRKNISYVIRPNPRKENKPFLARPQTERNASFGAQNFAELHIVENANFIKDDCIFVKIDVETDKINMI